MFPDLTSDDIFRIETKRLWLRWPRVADAAAISTFASLPETAKMTAAIPHPYPVGEAERFIFQARADNANGKGLILAITLKRPERPLIGLVSATLAGHHDLELGYVIAPTSSGKGYATEAVKGMVNSLFSVTSAHRILANVRAINPASHRVLEKSGFTYVDSGLDYLPARGGLHPCDRFEFDRKTWVQQHPPRGMPPMIHQTKDRQDALRASFQPSVES
ncbi:GNAT family N-acetyltransferase [Beijerinckia indica]|uniref:GCN5-related N-acetyltransferase n=1 Tax=Beijerinckia indica subsp. indica (strain ATCC 9039 / DSM 1715 / NCIMB 8712) TaxID=395963 RepID=B2IE45_BEII9|nr:GNAT family N-acetyltransferase [Beijerinckia indica]ACB94069.1 GCN5-related N-acetyltransferase [Beijerinckia indica subsp. indica ATCC 9039]